MKNAEKKQKKKKGWLRFRHRVVRNILFGTLGVYSRLKYRIKIEKFKEQEDRPYLILFNHQTAFDQFFVGMSFKKPVYYLASEDIFSNGKVSSLIRYLVAPIPIKKQTTDVRAILNCIKVAREGGTIAIAPEGNRTYSGKTEYMSPSIVPLAKKLGLPIVLYRIEGGYGVHPRWSDVVRKGKMRSYVSKVVYPEEYKTMTDDELFSIIEKELFVDEAVADAEFHHKKSAEYLERAIYVCPYCGISEFHSEGNIIECKKCHRKIKYSAKKQLSGVGFDFPFEFVSEWYEYQKDFITKLDVKDYEESPIYANEEASFSEVIPYQNKVLICENAKISLYGNKISIDSNEDMLEFDFDSTSAVTVLGKNKLNIYKDGKIYQLKGGKRFNALKYVNIYHRYQNVLKGVENEQFLGL